MLKNIFSFILGTLTGIVLMDCLVFILQSEGRMDYMPIIMIACILILIAIGIITYFVVTRKARARDRAEQKTLRQQEDSQVKNEETDSSQN